MAEIINYVVNAVWFILPAVFANIAPVFSHKLFGKYNYPIDFYKEIKPKVRVLGDGKTWNGLIFGTLVGGLVGYLQSFTGLGGSLPLGLTLGFGALFGDAVKSFFKRQLGKVRGAPWFPFDQIDFILGAFLLYYIAFRQFNLPNFIILLLGTPAFHYLFNWIGFKLKLKQVPW